MTNSVLPPGANPIDEYIAHQPEAYRAKLMEIRAIVLSVVPDAEQLISYQVPSFKYIYMLVGMGVTKTHCSLYIMSSVLSKKLKQQSGFEGLKGTTLHFDLSSPLPTDLIKQIVALRVAENEQIHAARSIKKASKAKNKKSNPLSE